MATAFVNNQPIELAPGEQLNCIEAARRVGVDIPHYCWHRELSVVASCRMCLVEVGDRKPDGSVVMQPRLVPGCQTPVRDGTIVVADSPKVKQARQATLEYLLLNHPLDCPTCDQAGECFLQDYSYKHGRGYSRLDEPKNQKADKTHIGEQITLFTDRCIMCTRCVRFTREISGTAELMVTDRGTHEEIDIFPGQPCDNKLAGNVVDLCPVGALCSKDFLYKQRVWWLRTTPSVCPNCSTGCSIDVDQNEDRVYRLTPRTNPLAQGDFMCDEGRFGWKYIHSEQRLTFPEMRLGIGNQRQALSRDWDDILPVLRDQFTRVARERADAVAVVLSPWMTVEEAFLLVTWIKSLTPGATFALTPARNAGSDDCYPKDVRGNAVHPPRFVIRGEKAPNRLGVELVLKHLVGATRTFEQVLHSAAEGQFRAVYMVGGDPEGWINAEQASSVAGVEFLVVQDILASPVADLASCLLPGGTFAERDGLVVNHAGLAQELHRAVRGPEGARPDIRILWELTGRSGLPNLPQLRQELAALGHEFAPLAQGDVGELGVRLDLKGETVSVRPAVPAPARS